MDVLLRGAIPLTIADATAKGTNIIVALLIARFYGPTIYGQFATASAVCGLFLIATAIGFEQELTRRGGIDKATIPQGLRLTFVSIGIMAFLAYAFLIVFFAFGTYSYDIVYLGLFLGVTLIATRFHLPFRHLCLLLDKSHLTAIIQSCATVVIFIISICLIYFRLNIIFLILAQLVVALCFIGVWLKWTPKMYLVGKINRDDLKLFFKNAIPFAFSNVIWIAYFNFDTFMLSLMRTEAEVGVYAGVYRIIGVNYILGYALANAFTPKLYEFYNSNKQQFLRTGRQLFGVVFVIGLLIGSGLYIFSFFLIPFILGQSYLSGIEIAQVLSIAIVFRLLNFGLCEILTTSNRQMLRVRLEVLMLLTYFVLNLFLITHYDAIGSATATVMSEVSLLVGCLFFCYHEKLLSILRVPEVNPSD